MSTYLNAIVSSDGGMHLKAEEGTRDMKKLFSMRDYESLYRLLR